MERWKDVDEDLFGSEDLTFFDLDIEGTKAPEFSTQPPRTVTAMSRSIEIKPDIIFLGNKVGDSSELLLEEEAPREAGQDSASVKFDPILRPGAGVTGRFGPDTLQDDIFDDIMTKWLVKEQQQVSNLMVSFMKQTQQHFQEQSVEMELQFLQQRDNVKEVLAGVLRRVRNADGADDSKNAALRSCIWSGHQPESCTACSRHTSVISVSVESGDSEEVVSFEPGGNSSTSSRCSHLSLSPRQGAATKATLILEQTLNPFLRSLSRARGSNRHSFRESHNSLAEKSERIQRSYANAARMMQDRSALTTIIQDRITTASKHDSLLKKACCNIETGNPFVEGHRFQAMIAILIVLNAIFIGITSDLAMLASIESHEQKIFENFVDIKRPEWALGVDLVFNVIFIGELALRLFFLESRFCIGPDWRWNFFDTSLVALSIIEMSLESLGFNPSFLRVLRIVRVTRSLRMLRLMRFTHFVRKLRLVTVAIVNCGMMLVWAVLVLLIVTFLFSVIFINAASQYVADASDRDLYVAEFKEYFGSLFMTMVTLFMSVAGGIDWWTVLRLLIEIHVGYALLFMLFVVITVLAVLNVISAIFVNDAIESTRTDHDLRVQGELEETRLMLERLTGIFGNMEKQYGTQQISERDFVEQVEREEVKMQLNVLGLHYTDGRNFFRLLDVDGSRWLGVDEFVMGCLSLKGGALLIDSNVLIQDTRSMVTTMARSTKNAMEVITTSVKMLCDKVAELERDCDLALSDSRSDRDRLVHIASTEVL